jgi:hypothetical protein
MSTLPEPTWKSGPESGPAPSVDYCVEEAQDALHEFERKRCDDILVERKPRRELLSHAADMAMSALAAWDMQWGEPRTTPTRRERRLLLAEAHCTPAEADAYLGADSVEREAIR